MQKNSNSDLLRNEEVIAVELSNEKSLEAGSFLTRIIPLMKIKEISAKAKM